MKGDPAMKIARKITAPIVLASLILLALPSHVRADKPPSIPAWYNGNVVIFTVVSDNVVGVDHNGVRKRAIPLYSFGPPGFQPQFDVLSAVPGVPRYNPWWEVKVVIPLDGRNVSTNPYTSEAEILAARGLGKVLIIDIEFFFLCQVLPGRSL